MSVHANASASVNLAKTVAVIHALGSIYTWILVQNKKKKGNDSSDKMQLSCCSLPKDGEGAKQLHKESLWKKRSTDTN